MVDTALGPRQPRRRPPHSSCRRFCLCHVSVLSATPFPDHAILLPLSFLLFSVCVSLLFSVNFSPFLPLSFPISLLSLLALSRVRARARARALLVTLSQSIQLDLASHPPALHPRNAFQPPLTPPRPRPRCNLPLSPGPLPPSIPSAFPLLHRGATLTPPATAQTPPNRATPGLIKEQRGSGARGSLPLGPLSSAPSFPLTMSLSRFPSLCHSLASCFIRVIILLLLVIVRRIFLGKVLYTGRPRGCPNVPRSHAT